MSNSGILFSESARLALSREYLVGLLLSMAGILAVTVLAIVDGRLGFAINATSVLWLLLVLIPNLVFWSTVLLPRTTVVGPDGITYRRSFFRSVHIPADAVVNWSEERPSSGGFEIVVGTGASELYRIPTRRPTELIAAIHRLKSAPSR